MGSDNSHLRLGLTSPVGDFTAIWWKRGDVTLKSGDNLDLAFHPQINEFNGNRTVQLQIKNYAMATVREVL